MFYKCPSCKRVWQYPIEKCPFCFLNLERIKSKKARVIGIAKVSLPSLFHPKVPYFVLVLEDENKNRWIQKSQKEYKIGEEIEFERTKEKNGVFVWKVKYDFFEAIEKAIEAFGGIKVNEQSKILILPTLVSASHPYFRENTSPEFLKATLEFLFELGANPKNIKVCSQSFDEIEIGIKAIKSGLLKVCNDFKVLAQDLSKTKFIKKGDLEISEEVFKSDLILNLPILKIGKAQATENLFFLLKKENFLAQKYLFSEKEVFEKLKTKIPQILTIAEGEHVKDEKGFTHYLNLILASFDPKNLDRVFFEILKRPLPEIIKDVKIEKISIFGKKLEEL